MKVSETFNISIRKKEDIYKHESIILWGAGFACSDCIDSIGREYIKDIFDNDSRKWGKNLYGFSIKSPQNDLKKYIDSKTAVVIATNGYEYEIAADLIKRGVDISSLFSNTNHVVEQYRYKPDVIEEHLDNIQNSYQMFGDEHSKLYYINFIKACLSRNPLYFKDNPCCEIPYEYHSEQVRMKLSGGETILDCGAYDGDTARIFMKKTNNRCQIYCFEPVVENFKIIEEWVKKEHLENIHVIHSGVGDSKRIDKVYSTESQTSKAAVGLNRFQSEHPFISEIPVDTLDHMTEGLDVNYIKMDIEGAEMEALRGAIFTIQEKKPQMLISGYHKIEDMWEIPEFVMNLNPNYRMFLGHQPHAPYEPEFLFI